MITIPQANTYQIGNSMKWAINKVSEKYRSLILHVIIFIVLRRFCDYDFQAYDRIEVEVVRR